MRLAAPCLIVGAYMIVGLVRPAAPERRASDEGARLLGVWEQTSLKTDAGSLEIDNPDLFRMQKTVLVWSDTTCYWIDAIASEPRITKHETQFHANGRLLTFVNPDNNRTIRCLYHLKQNSLALCLDTVRTIRPPERFAPAANGVIVKDFKRLATPSSADKKKGLSGLWETVGYEVEGASLENTNREHFQTCRKVFCFQDDVYTLVGADEGGLIVVHKPYEIKPKVNSHAVDFVAEDGKAIRAIYKTEGDTLVICWNHQGGIRPNQFRTEAGDGRAVIRLKRVDDALSSVQHGSSGQAKIDVSKVLVPREVASQHGVWQQIGLQNQEGDLAVTDPRAFELQKRLAVWKGSKCYWIRSAALGVLVSVEDVHFHPDKPRKALDFVDPTDHRTVRCLYELDNNTWTLCFQSGFKTLRKPVKIAPTADGFAVHLFKRLPGPGQQAPPKAAQALFGVWNTVGGQVNGVELTEMENIIDFRKNQRMFYFQPEFYTVAWADAGPLRVVHNRYELKPNESKEAIDFVGENDQNIPAIYKIDKDGLTICWNNQGGPRPDTFVTAAGDGRRLFRLKRVEQ